MYGRDLDGRPLIWTTDERDNQSPVKPYPDKEYLRAIIQILYDEPFGAIEKCRQMIMSTTLLLMLDYRCRFKPGRRAILSKRTEHESKDMLRDKLRAVHQRLPEWVQKVLPMRPRPAGKIIYPHAQGESYILGANEAMAEGQGRGGTASDVLIDEAAYQDKFREIWAACMPMTAGLWACTTPALGTPGADEFTQLMDSAKNVVWTRVMEGLSVRRSPAGFLTVRLEHTADPDKRGEAFLANARKLMPSDRDFRREFLLERTAARSSATYYPEFHENGGRDRYLIQPPIPLIGKREIVIYRGWDFGTRKPACVWAQCDNANKRLVVLHELMPGWWDRTGTSDYGIDVRTFRDVVLYVSGQLGESAIVDNPRAMHLLEILASETEYPMPPWFKPIPGKPTRFVDFALGKEINKRADEDVELRTRRMILAEGGIDVMVTNEDWKLREEVMRELLKVRDDGWPGLLLTPACPILINAFESGLQYVDKTKARSLPEASKRDGYFEHLHDCLNYIAVSVIPAVQWREHASRAFAMLSNQPLPIDDGIEFWVGGN